MSEERDPSVPCDPAPCESPPPADAPPRDADGDELAQQLRRMARELMRTQNRRLVVEYLQLRRAVR
jgi:hypothetical protein